MTWMKKNKSHKSTGKPDHFLPDGGQKIRVILESLPHIRMLKDSLSNHRIFSINQWASKLSSDRQVKNK